MTDIQVLVAALIVACFGWVATATLIAVAVSRQLLWFHKAGQSMAAHQLELAKIEVDGKKAEAERARADADMAIASRHVVGKINTPTGGSRQSLTGGA